MKNEIKLEAWYKNRLWDFFHKYLNKRMPFLSVLIFFFYWLVPFICIFFNTQFGESRALSSEQLTSYLNDTTHLYFALAITLSGAVGIYIFRIIPEVLITLINEKVLALNEFEIIKEYNKNREIANHWLILVGSIIVGIITGMIFFRFFYFDIYTQWWGNIKFGYVGLYFVIVEMVVLFFCVQAAFLLIISSKLYIKIIKGGFYPKIYHADQSNGLGSLGSLILVKWLIAICAVLCGFIVLYFGYMELEKTAITAIAIVIITFTVPIIAILPLLSSLKEIRKIKTTKLKKFGLLLNNNLESIEKHIDDNEMGKANNLLSSFIETKELFSSINQMNVFPFNPKALASVLVAYSFQIGITIYQLFFK